MANRSHVDVNERRLKPIYDYIDNRNYKKAVQEADRVLKKQKDLLCAKALKGLALIRQGKQDSGLELLREVHGQRPTDDATLQAVTISYGEMQEFESIVDLYEHANKLKPENEDLLSALFMAYVRTGSYQKQQRTAMSLHKLKPDKNPYYFWALMSIVMQAHATDDDVKKQTFLKLAEKMAEKFITTKKVEAEAEVMMYLMILELEGKFQESLELLNGPLGTKFQELNYRSAHSAELYVKLEQWSKVNTEYKSLLVQEPDQWCYYQSYIHSVITLVKENNRTAESEGELPVDASLEQAQWFIKSRITCCEEKNQKLRGPYLAELELIQRSKSENLDYSCLSSAYDLMSNFCKLFSRKSSCYGDLKPYLGLVSVEQKQALVDELEKDVNLGPGSAAIEPDYPEDEPHMWRHLTLCYFKHHLTATWSADVEDLIAKAQEYCMRHENGLRFGAVRLKTDYQPSDDYLLLSTTIYNHLYLRSGGGDMNYLWTLIGLLERGLVCSPSNFKFKILLVHFYCILGAFTSAAEHWESLDVKHIQHDSLGYVIVNHAVRFGHYPRAGEILSNMLKFFTINNKETTDFLISSYKYGSFNKINEFVRFRQRLQNSYQFASATAEKLHMDLMVDPGTDCGVSVLMDIDPEHDKTELSELVDNRDLNVLQLAEHPEMPLNDEYIHESFEEEKNWLKIRNLTIRMMAAASQFDLDGNVTIQLTAVKNGNQPARCMQEVLSELMVQLQEHVTDLDERYKGESDFPLTGLFRTRIAQYLQQSHATILIEFCKCLLYLYKFSIKTEEGAEQAIKFTCCDRVLELTEEVVPCCTVRDDELLFDAKHLERLVMVSELLCQVTLLVTIGYRILRPLKQPGQKRGKKRQSADLTEVTAKFNGLVQKLKNCYGKVESVLNESLNATIRSTAQGIEKVDLSSETKDDAEQRPVGIKKVLASYQISIGNMSQVLQKKKACLQLFPS